MGLVDWDKFDPIKQFTGTIMGHPLHNALKKLKYGIKLALVSFFTSALGSIIY